jgi:hypothetical protein
MLKQYKTIMNHTPSHHHFYGYLINHSQYWVVNMTLFYPQTMGDPGDPGACFSMFFPNFRAQISSLYRHLKQNTLVFHLFSPSFPSVFPKCSICFSQVFHHFSSLFPSFPSVFPKFSIIFHHFFQVFHLFFSCSPSFFITFPISFSPASLSGASKRAAPAERRAGVGSAESTSAPLRRRGFGEVGKAVKAGCAWRNGWDRMI